MQFRLIWITLALLLLVPLAASTPDVGAYAAACPPENCTAGRDVGRDFFVEVVDRLSDVPMSDFAVDALVLWEPYEYTRACWNPLATTQKMEGSCFFNCLNPECTIGVQHYLSQTMGTEATAATLSLSYYNSIRKMLRREEFNREGLRSDLSTWGTCSGSGCDSLLDTWQNHWDNNADCCLCSSGYTSVSRDRAGARTDLSTVIVASTTTPVRTVPPTPTPTVSPTQTPDPTKTPTHMPTATLTQLSSATPMSTHTATPTSTPTVRLTSTPTWTPTLIPDTTPPRGTLTINSGAGETRSLNIALQLQAEDEGRGVTEMRFSRDGVEWGEWGSYQQIKRWRFTGENGPRTIYVQFRDAAGNVSEPTSATINVNLTTEKPSSETFRILSSVMGIGGGEKSSSNYRVQSTTGQPSSPAWSSEFPQSSESFQVLSGFWGAETSSLPCTLQGDIDGDNDVDLFDLTSLAGNWRMTSDHPDWKDKYDFDGDKRVTVVDLQSHQMHWGDSCP